MSNKKGKEGFHIGDLSKSVTREDVLRYRADSYRIEKIDEDGKIIIKATEVVSNKMIEGRKKYDFPEVNIIVWIIDKSDGIARKADCSATIIDIPPNCFANNKDLKGIIIPETVQTIRSHAFSGSGITNLNIPENVTQIETEAFAECEELANVEFNEGLTTIGIAAFRDCIRLSFRSSKFIPKSVKSIGAKAFEGCEKIYDVDLSENDTTIKTGCFANCNKLKNIFFPYNIKKIPERCCKDCSDLKSTNLGELQQLETIDESAFERCRLLSITKWPETISAIKKKAFRGCTGLSGDVHFNENISVGIEAFYGCPNIRIHYRPKDAEKIVVSKVTIDLPEGILPYIYISDHYLVDTNDLLQIAFKIQKGMKDNQPITREYYAIIDRRFILNYKEMEALFKSIENANGVYKE